MVVALSRPALPERPRIERQNMKTRSLVSAVIAAFALTRTYVGVLHESMPWPGETAPGRVRM